MNPVKRGKLMRAQMRQTYMAGTINVVSAPMREAAEYLVDCGMFERVGTNTFILTDKGNNFVVNGDAKENDAPGQYFE